MVVLNVRPLVEKTYFTRGYHRG